MDHDGLLTKRPSLPPPRRLERRLNLPWVGAMSPQRLHYTIYVQVLTLFSAGKLLLLLCDLNSACIMFLVYNATGNSYDVLAMQLVSQQPCLQAPSMPPNQKGDA